MVVKQHSIKRGTLSTAIGVTIEGFGKSNKITLPHTDNLEWAQSQSNSHSRSENRRQNTDNKYNRQETHTVVFLPYFFRVRSNISAILF